VARRAVDRSATTRQEVYAADIRRVMDVAYRLIEQSGNVDPSMREILKESGLSTEGFYRYFHSKNELFVLLLDDGRRRLLSYLDHQMGKVDTPPEKLRAWVEGVLAQAVDPEAARRTRPFVIHEARLAEALPNEQHESVILLVDQVVSVLRIGRGRRSSDVRRDAQAVYDLAFGRLHRHLLYRTEPTPLEVEHLVGFILKGVGL
jgi:AcrR family transcriptional regulator